MPEWYLVYSPGEYAHYIKQHEPSGYPYFASIKQFWDTYKDVRSNIEKKYPFNWGYHVMVFVIGSSFTTENTLKGVYERTIGRVAEWTAGSQFTEEDHFAAEVAQHYVDFIRVTP